MNMQIPMKRRFICIFLITIILIIIGETDCKEEKERLSENSPRFSQTLKSRPTVAGGTIFPDQSVTIKDEKKSVPLRTPRFTRPLDFNTLNLTNDGGIGLGLLAMYNLTDYPFLCLNTSRTPKDDGRVYCNATLDPFSCWPATLGGHYAVISCPEVPGVDATKNATKYCFPNGTWMSKANYNACMPHGIADENDIEFQGELATDYVSRIIYNLGFSISTVALAIALFIFTHFRSLRCLRNVIHCHLIVTFILRNVVWFVLQHTLVPIVANQETWACKLQVAVFNYAQMTNFFWMLVEGLYLHIIIVWTYSADKIRRWYLIVLGWGIPLLIIAVWSSLRIYSTSVQQIKSSDLQDCWLPYNTSQMDPLDYIHIVPTLLVLAINMLFLATIIWVLVTKLRASNSLETIQLRKVVKATLLLLPLLGITYLLFLYSPTDDKAVVEAHKFINTFLQSFQGFFVALFYCFLNEEVKSVLKKKFNTLRENRTLATRCTKTSIGWANDITIQKDHVALTNGNRQTNAYNHNDRPDLKISDHYSREDGLESEKML